MTASILSSRVFGTASEYRLSTVLTRFGTIEFFVDNAQGECVGQASTVSGAVVNLPQDEQEDCLRRQPRRKGQKAINLDRHPVKVIGDFDPLRGVKVQCLGTGQKWFADPKLLVLAS